VHRLGSNPRLNHYATAPLHTAENKASLNTEHGLLQHTHPHQADPALAS